MSQRKFRVAAGAALVSLALTGCVTDLQQGQYVSQLDAPAVWQTVAEDAAVKQGWLASFNEPDLQALVMQAIGQNQQLKQQWYKLKQAEQDVVISGADLWPSLDLSTSVRRSKDNQPVSYNNAASVSLDVSYELDITGKIAAAEQRANLLLKAEQLNYQQALEQLVADVALAYFDLIRQQELLTLQQQQVANAKADLDIIERGYQQGLNEALDVYLTRNALASEQAALAEQKTSHLRAVRTLERLVGGYPHGRLIINKTLPVLDTSVAVGIPSELITRKPALQSAWYSLLSSNASLAIAHKNRYPSIRLSAALSDSGDNLGDLLSSSQLAWSLLGSLSAPIFQGGRLEAQQEKAALAVKQSEQTYLDTLYDAFNQVENALTQQQNLAERYLKTLAATENAERAEQLSFKQYQRGLVSYTTVLDAQDRAFNAQTNLLNLRYQRIENRIALFLALGGSYDQSSQNSANPSNEIN